MIVLHLLVSCTRPQIQVCVDDSPASRLAVDSFMQRGGYQAGDELHITTVLLPVPGALRTRL